jgi:hypothetical protein
MYLLTVKKILLVGFIICNYKFSVVQKMLCMYTLAAKSLNILEIVQPRLQATSTTILLSVR